MFNDDISLAQIEKATAQALLQRQVSNSDDLFDDIPIEELVQALDRQEDRSPQGTMNTVVVNESLGILSRASSSTTAVTVTEEKTVVTEIKKPVPAEEKRKKFTRYLVANITTNTFEVSDRVATEKVLTLIQEDSNTAITARLRDDWLQTTISVGNVVHIPFTNNTTEVIIDQRKNFIIVHPDRLISCTTVAESYHCLRRSILQTKIRGVTECTEALVHGSILHRVLQNALLTGDFSIESIKEEMEQIVASSLENLYTLDVDEKTTLEALNQYVESIHEFGNMFVGNEPKPNARVSSDKGPDAAKALGCETVAISKVLDIEEHLWSPTYGLKGMIDASVQLKMSPINRVLTVPFELKTGKSSKFLTNRAQTVLYTLLMSDRYDIDIGAGILYYSKTNSLYLVPALRNEVASMIIARNELASALYSHQVIPPMIKNFHTCQYCCLADACTIYHKAIEKGNGVSSGLYKLFEERTNHMTTKTSSFFKHWWQLLDKEELDIDYLRKEIWSQPAEEREKSGRCISNLKLNISASEILPEIAQWKYCFVRAEPNKPLFCNLSIGDAVVVSSMEGHISLAMGHVSSLTADEIILGLNEPLRSPPKRSEDFDLLNNQQFQTFIRYRADVEKHYKDSNVLYRIDKDEMSTAMNMLRYNLVSLVANTGDERTQRLRELIIDLEKPAFDTTVVPTMPISSHLNPDQRNVITKVLQAKDYNLILGMPGTGKTTTTAEIIKYLVGMNKTILVTAFTHTALDNVLSKVRDQGIDVLRLGNIDKVMQSMKDCVPSLNRNITTVEEMKIFYDSKRVVGVTCLGIGQ
ncbi:Dna2-domain-containing protein [Rhizopus microsporus ATCC 52813]|uniref:DNA helicase n=1 Tax=Rhizopus microsporus ATCC 52813 TaxID=1340429 RepID=A0A2G4SU76_RHIZD|nr:Dna2-domain-containing protein [Rhizopus microsporus ATCC 52813]PHZ11946.1 Dna2-domain-containing protein [Rhizopus microsporus ATCC 52813]